MLRFPKYATPKHERRATGDFYATPAHITKALLAVEKFEGEIWECCCGEGHISKVLKRAGYKVKSTDLFDRGYGRGGVDFLECWDKCDNIVSNPPYIDGMGIEFLNHSLLLARRKVAFLFPLNFLETPKRRAFLRHSGLKTVWVFSQRVAVLKNGKLYEQHPRGSTVCYCWFVFENGWKQKPVIDWID